MSKLWIVTAKTEILCDTCIYEDDNACCTAEDCCGGDHYDNQNTFEFAIPQAEGEG